jgi:DeoR family transcriptional regulator, fructose operon transcriptional repressor
VLLADHTKLGNDYFARFGSLAAVDTFITDSGADAELVDEISEAGPRVVLA